MSPTNTLLVNNDTPIVLGTIRVQSLIVLQPAQEIVQASRCAQNTFVPLLESERLVPRTCAALFIANVLDQAPTKVCSCSLAGQ